MLVSLMLVSAVAVSLAVGVLMAYGICRAMFRIFRMQAMAAARQREARSGLTAKVLQPIEG